MSAVEYRFIEPLDVLILRGNKLFGDPGSFGESLIPPWPSVVAGAVRSRILADDGIDLAGFAAGRHAHSTLGTPQKPGSFAIAAFHLARRLADRTEILVAAPADLIIGKSDADLLDISLLTPTAVGEGLASSFPLEVMPVLAQSRRSKPASGYWLTQLGWQQYLAGDMPEPGELIASNQLWKIDPRIGVGLDSDTRSAADGRLFSTQAVALTKQGNHAGINPQTGQPVIADYDVGFLVGISGAPTPTGGLLRLGGDGRAAAIAATAIHLPEPDYEAIAKARRCRIVLTTPGLFPAGWKLPGTGVDNRISIAGIRARLACAAVPRAEVISGWDLANAQPKSAQRVAATGSVYWLDEIEASADDLCKLVKAGLWEPSCEDSARRAEGFNRFSLAQWNR